MERENSIHHCSRRHSAHRECSGAASSAKFLGQTSGLLAGRIQAPAVSGNARLDLWKGPCVREHCEGRGGVASRETPDPRRAAQAMVVDTTVYPRELCAVQVFVGKEPAGLLYVQEKQINFKVPQNLPVQGAVELKVVFQGRSSAGVPLEVGADRPKLSLEGVAPVGGPVWIRVELPYGLGAVAYPGGQPPLDFGCNQLEVRRTARR